MKNTSFDIEAVARQIEALITALDDAGHELAAAYADTCLQALQNGPLPVAAKELELTEA